MAFKTRFDNGAICPKCKVPIGTAEWVEWADSEQKVLQHKECDFDNAGTDPGDKYIRWENLTEESLERAGLLEQELARVAPLAREGKCPKCHIELPKTKICGYCS